MQNHTGILGKICLWDTRYLFALCQLMMCLKIQKATKKKTHRSLTGRHNKYEEDSSESTSPQGQLIKSL